MKSSEDTLFGKQTKREKKRDAKQLKKFLKQQLKAIGKSEVIIPESRMADILELLSGMQKQLDAIISCLSNRS